MALRVCNKITSSIIQNFCRQLSAKADLASSAATTKDVTGKDEATTPKSQVYSLGQMQSLNLNKKYNTQQMCSEIEIAKKNIENQSLQPSMLPNYYENTMDLGMSVNNEGNTDQKRSSEMYRSFKKSETYSKVTLPLRPSKLASPFPDPVKVMQSHTVSDEEKAAQMLADSRASRYSQKQEQHKFNFVPNRSFSTTSAAFRRRKGSSDTVSTDPKKCKKLPRDDKKVCKKMKLPGCEAPKRTTCKRLPMVVKCKKQEAPYPSYSESCHEDIEEKPSECKMCPWKPDQHPYFRPSNKEFHTASSQQAQQRRRDGTEKNKDEDGSAIEELLVDNREPSKLQEVSTREGSGLDMESPADTAETEPFSYKCDLRKKPCKPPKRRSCADRDKKGKKGRKGKKRRKGKKGRRGKGKGKRGKRRRRKGRKGGKGKKRKGKRHRKGRRRGKKRTMGWTEATRAWAQRGGDVMPELRLDMIERDFQQTAMEMSRNKKIRDQSRSSKKTNRKNKRNKKHSLGWTEAARAWAERTDGGLAAEVRAASPLQQAQDFHEAPPHLDWNNEAGTGMLCKKRGRGGRRRKGKKGGRKKKKGRKGKGRDCDKKKKKPKCKKFPLGDCKPPKRKGHIKTGRCPPKKKKKPIKDCPPDDDRGCKRSSSINGNWEGNKEYNLPSREMMQEPYMRMFEDEGKGKRRCPKPDLTIAKDYEIKKCPKKRNPSRICPGNLLRKKRRNKYRGRKGRNRRNRTRRDTSSRHVSVPLSLHPDASAPEESVRI